MQAWVRTVGLMLDCRGAVAVELWGGGRVKIKSMPKCGGARKQ